GFRTTTKSSEQPAARDIELTPGIVVRGRVTDSRTQKPLSGTVHYFAFSNNPHLREARGFDAVHSSGYRADEDGHYAIPVLPGGGILTFNADEHEHYSRGAGAEEIEGPRQQTKEVFFLTSPYLVTPYNFHLLKGLNLAPETEEFQLDLTLASGTAFTARLRTTDGQPLANYYVFGEMAAGGWYGGHSGETFEVTGYLPEEGRRVMVYEPDRNLVGLADITGAAPKDLEIEVRP